MCEVTFVNSSIKATLLGCVVAVLVGCSSSPDETTFGGRLEAQGGAVAEIGEKWSEGAELIADGAALVEEGEDDLSRGRRLVRSGEGDIDKGRDMMRRGERLQAEAEAAYREAQAAGTVPGPVSN